MKKRPIIITGGHITPALAVIDAMQKRPTLQRPIILVGRKYAFDSQKYLSQEERHAKRYGIPFIPLTAGRLSSHISLSSVLGLLKIPIGFLQACMILLRYRPLVIVSFGGYVALPVVLAAKLLGISVLTHEQTSVPGVANSIIMRFADVICLTIPVSTHVSRKQEIITGLPIRKFMLEKSTSSAYAALEKPILYITGGSTGAESLNTIIFPAIDTLTKKYSVVHQTGLHSLHSATIIKQKLPSTQAKRYIPISFLDEEEVAWVMQHASLIIGRSGANTVGEIAALGKIALFIPLPWSRGGEQQKNAEVLQHDGSARVILQKDLTHQTLIQSVEKMMQQKSVYSTAAKKIAQKMILDADERIVDQIEQLII